MKIKDTQLKPAELIPQFVHALGSHLRAVRFTRKHKLWQGFWRYGWVSKLLILGGLFMGLKFFSIFVEWIEQFREADSEKMMVVISGMFTDFFNSGYAELFSGGTKYLMLILLEVIIFHMCRRTLEILNGKYEAALGFNDFIKAQIRMFKVGIYSWILEIVVSALAGIGLGIFSIGFLENGVVFIAQCYFLGWAVVDNYNEQFGLTINESLKYTSQYFGIALAVGAVLYIIMLIPIVGPIAGPIIAAVTATIVMYELSDLHLRPKTEEAEPGEPLAETV